VDWTLRHSRRLYGPWVSASDDGDCRSDHPRHRMGSADAYGWSMDQGDSRSRLTAASNASLACGASHRVGPARSSPRSAGSPHHLTWQHPARTGTSWRRGLLRVDDLYRLRHRAVSEASTEGAKTERSRRKGPVERLIPSGTGVPAEYGARKQASERADY